MTRLYLFLASALLLLCTISAVASSGGDTALNDATSSIGLPAAAVPVVVLPNDVNVAILPNGEISAGESLVLPETSAPQALDSAIKTMVVEPAAPAPPATPEAPVAETPAVATVSGVARTSMGSDGRLYHCCDNADCSPSSPSYGGDCDKLRPDCNNIVCPPYEVAFPPTLPTDPSCKSWTPIDEICKCSCRCICIYGGRVKWMDF